MGFNEGLCGCFGDCNTCLLSFCCPCIQFAYNVTKNDNIDVMEPLGCCIGYLIAFRYFFLCVFPPFIVCCCLPRALVHWQTRIKLGNTDDPAEMCLDFLAVWCCMCCAIAQEGQQVK